MIFSNLKSLQKVQRIFQMQTYNIELLEEKMFHRLISVWFPNHEIKLLVLVRNLLLFLMKLFRVNLSWYNYYSLFYFINNKFTIQWKQHEIRGEYSYFKSWIEITRYANDLAEKIAARFPSTPFLDALKILDPQEWKRNRENSIYSGILWLH